MEKLKYTEILNRLDRLFSTLTSSKQISMAHRYSYRLILKATHEPECTENCDMAGMWIKDELISYADDLYMKAHERLSKVGA